MWTNDLSFAVDKETCYFSVDLTQINLHSQIDLLL